VIGLIGGWGNGGMGEWRRLGSVRRPIVIVNRNRNRNRNRHGDSGLNAYSWIRAEIQKFHAETQSTQKSRRTETWIAFVISLANC
jgi:hypothetical protein